VGILSGRSRQAAVDSGNHGAFLERMRELGYVEGRSVHYESRYAGGDYAELRRMAGELVRLNVDVIVAEGTTAIDPLRQASATIPIVMATSADPVGSGLVASLGRPRGNVTGLTSSGIEATAKRIELLVAALPGLSRVALLVNPDSRTHPTVLREARSAAGKFKVKVIDLRAGSPEGLESAFVAMRRERAGAVIVPADAFFNSQRRQIVDLAAKNRIPALYTLREFFDAGGLFVHGVDLTDLYRRAASYVDKILKGAKPGDLPVEQPDKFELLVNLRAAKALGLTIPQNFLMRADEVSR
jgi:putative ABC transport system substrate-binding protein